MVTIEEIQAAYYMVAATGVLVAAVFYIVNLRETSKNRKITLTTTMMQPFITKEGMRDLIDLYSMEWSDWDDYMRKYDSRVNPENFAKRTAFWNVCEALGYQYKTGLVDIETLFGVTYGMIPGLWAKFRPIVIEYRKGDFSKRRYENWERMASDLKKIQDKYDAEYKGTPGYFKGGEYDEAYKNDSH